MHTSCVCTILSIFITRPISFLSTSFTLDNSVNLRSGDKSNHMGICAYFCRRSKSLWSHCFIALSSVMANRLVEVYWIFEHIGILSILILSLELSIITVARFISFWEIRISSMLHNASLFNSVVNFAFPSCGDFIIKHFVVELLFLPVSWGLAFRC